jgi:hypothetical protein
VNLGNPCHAKFTIPAKEKCQPFSQDGWLFFFVPIAAETVSVLKEAGWQALRVLWPEPENRKFS